MSIKKVHFLSLGELDEIKELKTKVGTEKLRKIFLEYPSKVYQPSVLNFIKKFMLKIEEEIDINKYLKNTS